LKAYLPYAGRVARFKIWKAYQKASSDPVLTIDLNFHMQGMDAPVRKLMTHLDTWMGDRVAESQGIKTGEEAARLVKCGAKLAVAVLRGHIASPGLVKTLRRFLAAMLPTGVDAASEGK